MKKLLVSVAAMASLAFAGENMLTKGTSALSVDETVAKFSEILKEKGITLFDVFNHSKLAKDAGLEMTETSVVVFGAPKVGTLLMKCEPQIALELPMKFLIYKQDGKTTVAYEDIKNIAKRYNVQNCDIVEKLSGVQANLHKALTK
ncbi:DUF302 domain-containing protein [Campylobacter sp.]|uniref:DUF302 domain-containing protein n=1 Tax=Campylobacter sp. TaxID=205 RepID=UPI0026F65AAE|nr:DUF302 domain-containing protein [Campylobacter sp.]